MTDTRVPADLLFGSNVVAMVSPMKPDGSIDEAAVTSLVAHLLSTGCDGIVVNGTTGESATVSGEEGLQLIRQVKAQVQGQARVIAGVGTYDTRATIARAQAAEEAGADALLLVTPYYNRPTQAGVVAHTRAVADSTGLPIMLYDVPARTGLALSPATIVELAAHPRIQAIKDAKGDIFEALTVMARTGLAYYSGIDELNLPYLASGAVGVVSVVGNVVADRNAELIKAVREHDLERAQEVAKALIPLTDAIMRTSSGAIMAKAALAEIGVVPSAAVRLPLLESPDEDLRKLRAALLTIATPVA
ncbi:4-hydroxy-tetrahydrodipicolinate synthase [Kineosporia rhizophila]|uniref:4-hydroxy-tetrahydrodipicolinate synthase n=1 Tax=Kineosporia TaxID=49184 RepID=UPI001E57A591|nr:MULTISPECIES: 4-hydroxy-tetrahydrodipicolinate synthase [Kineosporia]MCE0534085.1 4-hydroxy-tetrahydrodipicolinate synthase [Kineosporia rhizophila]GLY13627.1 4-hydroxy-tetrahydrodipicolinate synthase [Kineosporia sp. NBRC 101677]